MRKRQRNRLADAEDLEEWEAFWSAFQSESEIKQSATTSRSKRHSTRKHMPPTSVVTVPAKTVTVPTTIYSTAFVTVPSISSATPGISTWQTSSGPSQETSSPTSASLTQTVSTAPLISLPPIVTGSPSSSSSSSSASTTADAAAAATTTATASATESDSQSGNQKQAIVGGLSGTIAGLVFIGLLICIILRIRRRKRDMRLNEPSDSSSEKGLPPAFIRTWTGLKSGPANKGSPKQIVEATTPVSLATVDEDHRIIRMSTRHWPRPFALGEGEGWRDSVPPGQLRVVNPDLSRPNSPRRSSETANYFLRRQRSALTGLVFGGNRRSSSPRRNPHSPSISDLPHIAVIEPVLSRDRAATFARSPSFRSYPSVSSVPVVVQQAPEDPSPGSVADMNRHAGGLEQQQQPAEGPIVRRTRRPSLATLHSAAEVAGRTWGRLSSQLLLPFRSRGNSDAVLSQNVRGMSHFSYSTNASHHSRRSDPFDLDRPSIRGSFQPESRAANEFNRKSGSRNWILYEGT